MKLRLTALALRSSHSLGRLPSFLGALARLADRYGREARGPGGEEDAGELSSSRDRDRKRYGDQA